jgi:RNA polymerase sigma factor (sigma-70 family)
VDHARRSVHREHLPLEAPIRSHRPDPSDEVHERLQAEWLAAALQRLAGPQRAVIILKFLEGMSNAQVASSLGMSVAAVKAHQHRGLKKLRQMLEAAGVRNQ